VQPEVLAYLLQAVATAEIGMIDGRIPVGECFLKRERGQV
jgi:hypothetical protein